MPDRERALRDALEAGINVLKENFGDDYDRALVLENVPLLLEVMWPYFEGYHERHAVRSFEETFKRKFPNYVLQNYGGTVLDYIIGNVQSAVCDEIIRMLESLGETMKEAQHYPKLMKDTQPRDWEVAQAHLREIISDIRSYRARGPHPLHTKPIELPEGV
jgi:hypothetical protein